MLVKRAQHRYSSSSSQHCSSSPQHSQPKLDRSKRFNYRNGDIFDYTVAPSDARPPWTRRYSRLIWIWNIVAIFSCFFRAFLDPLFLLLIHIQEGKNCIAIDPIAQYLKIAQYAALFIYVTHIIIKLCMAAREVHNNQYLRKLNLIKTKVLYDFLAIIPSLQHVLVYYDGKLPLPRYIYLYVVLFFLYFPSISNLIRQCHSGCDNKSDWGKILINLLFFIFAGHVVGSVWYIFGLQRVTECAGDVCVSLNISAIGCMLCQSNELIANEMTESFKTCFQEDGFSYGIFVKAVNLTKYGFFTRCSYSFFWGFQQISTLARNLVPTYLFGEIFFVMFIIVVGVVSFALFVGNLLKSFGDYWGGSSLLKKRNNLKYKSSGV